MVDDNLARRTVLAGAGAVTFGSLAGCLQDNGETDGYVIGMVDALTGTLAPYGSEYNERARELALEDINDVGLGSDNEELEIILEDSESSNQSGVNAAQRLINQENVPLLYGSVSSGVSIAIHESVVDGTDVVHIAQSSSGATVSDYPNLLRPVPSGAGKGAVLSNMMAEDGHDTIAVTWINNDYGDAMGQVVEEHFENEMGGTVAYNSSHDPGEASYSSELSEMADTDATAWLLATYADEATVLINDAYDQGYNEEVEYYGAESTIADTILENTEPGSQETLKGVREGPPEGSDVYAQFEERFNDEFDENPNVYSAYTYDALMWGAMAIEAADEFTGEAIAEHIREVTREPGEEVNSFEEAKEILEDGSSEDVNYVGPSGPGELDENGDPVGVYEIYTVEDHEYQIGDTISADEI
ncbi:ABC transporter substrate-binding protein [Natronorubrum sp. FCH18a]|uniref:ABC transporter substrate-binding protein n=1 Tax=Natronorubrum sp. FCH18a TaxID=3447018 RepID=UPI003F515E86